MSMWGDIADSLHDSVSYDGSSVNGEWSHHADQVSLEKSSDSVSSVTVSETL